MIFIVYGTRAEIIKFSPIIRELQRRRIPFKTVDTGQHENTDMTKSLRLPPPDFHLGRSFRSKWSGLEATFITYPVASMLALAWGLKVFVQLLGILSKGDVIVTHGNAMGVPLAIYAARISSRKSKLVHMESGFRARTGDARILDFIYNFADRGSDYLFTPYRSTEGNLRSEGIRGKVVFSGDVMADVVRQTMKIGKKTGMRGNYVVANLTRSIVNRHDAAHVIHAMADSPIDVILIMNPVIRKRIQKFGLEKTLMKSERIKTMSPTDYPSFLGLLKGSKGAITDSTGVQEECAVMGKPCIVTNSFVQIPELQELGIVRKTGCNYIGVLDSLRRIHSGRWKIKQTKKLFEKNATKIIVDHLVSLGGKK